MFAAIGAGYVLLLIGARAPAWEVGAALGATVAWILGDMRLIGSRHPATGLGTVGAALEIAALAGIAVGLRYEFTLLGVFPVLAEPVIEGDSRGAAWLGGFTAAAIVTVVVADTGGMNRFFDAAIWMSGAAFTLLMAASARIAYRESRRASGLVEDLKAAQAELLAANAQLSRSIELREVLAAERERNRMAVEVHDTVAHGLTALFVELQAIRTQVVTDPEAVGPALALAAEHVHESLREMRASVANLRVGRMAGEEPVQALRRLCDEFSERTSLAVELQVAAEVKLSGPEQHLVFRSVQEALTNAVRHGRATRARIELSQASGGWRLSVADNGEPTVMGPRGTGLTGIEDRAAELGGRVATAVLPGGGFALTVTWPSPPGEAGAP